jgi:hypothetical protein
MMGNLPQATELFETGLNTSSAPRLLALPQLLLGTALVKLIGGDPDQAKALVNEAEELATEHHLK